MFDHIDHIKHIITFDFFFLLVILIVQTINSSEYLLLVYNLKARELFMKHCESCEEKSKNNCQ